MKYPADIGDEIRSKRVKLGLTQKELADSIGLGANGDRSIRNWEAGSHEPNPVFLKLIRKFPETAPFSNRNPRSKVTFIDLFAGIGGTRLGFEDAGARCVFSSEWDKFAQKTYRVNFGETPHGDITKISSEEIPAHNILVAGFPCQPFSQAGLKKGFTDERGTLFWQIHRILHDKKPEAFLLENVKQLQGHQNGYTLAVILAALDNRRDLPLDLGLGQHSSEEVARLMDRRLDYSVRFKVLRAGDFGVPQNRERIYIVGFRRSALSKEKRRYLDEHPFEFPAPTFEATKLGDILEPGEVDPKYTISEKLWEGHLRRKDSHVAKGNGFGYSLFTAKSPYANTLSARYYKDGSEILIDQSALGKLPRKLTPKECARLMGFPDEKDRKFLIPVSDNQAYRQFGNSVVVPVVAAIAKSMLKKMKSLGLFGRATG